MKKIVYLLVVLLCTAISASACQFSISTEKDKKYCKVGEVFDINVKLTLVHRNCSLAPSETKFVTEGLVVKKASDWKETSPGIWTRKIKVKVLKNDKKSVKLTATRSCDRDGGYGTFTLVKK